MSFGGILATALAGGTGVIGKQAGDDIEAQRKVDMLRQQAAIEEQMRMRLSEFNAGEQRRSKMRELEDARAFTSSDETLAANKKIAMSASESARAARVAELTDEGFNTAQRKKARDDAMAAGDTAAEVTKKQAADPNYLKSISVLKLADPEVRARIASANASAGASAASARESAERLKQLGEVGKVASTMHGLQFQLSQAKTGEEREKIQQQITDLGFSGKDTKGFMAIAERAITNGDAALKVLNSPDADPAAKNAARAQLERANEFAQKAAGMAGLKIDGPAKMTEQQAHAEAEAAIKAKVPREAVNARLVQAGFKPLGDPGDKPGMTPGAERAARKPTAPAGPVAVAESQLRQAIDRLNSYGSGQRQRDPDGFRQAQSQAAQARAALAAAQEAEYGPVTVDDRKPSTRYAAP